MFCENCGSQMADGSKFCIACGAKAESKEGVLDGASQEVAASVDSSAAVVQEDTSVAVSTAAVPHEAASKEESTASQRPAATFVPPVVPQTAPPQSARPVQTQPVYQQQQQEVPQPFNVLNPASTKPLPVWKYIGIFILMGIPILNVIMIFVWAFGSSCNVNTRNYAKAILIVAVLFIVLTVVGYFTVWSSAWTFIQDNLSNYNLPISW